MNTGMVEFVKWLGVVPIIAVFLLVIVAYRSRSLHVIWYRVWAMAAGKEAVEDSAIAGFLAERKSLVSFSFFSGLYPSNLERARELIAWSNHNSIDLRELAACGSHFDCNTIRMSKPAYSRSWIVAGIAALFAVYCAAAAATIYGTMLDARLVFSDSKVGFWMGEGNVRRTLDSKALTIERCKFLDSILPGTGFDEVHAKTLCNYLNEEKQPKDARRIRDQQIRVAFALFIVFSLLLFVWGVLPLAQLNCSRLMADRLAKLNAPVA